MPSQDEQMIWDELHDFPEQVLAREKNEKILASIREERRKMRNQHKKRKYFGWMANGLVTCAVILALFWMKPFALPAETSGSASFVDPTYEAAAQKAIKATGITKEFHFEETEKATEYFIVRTKNREAIVTFKPDTTEVNTVSAIVASSELPDRYRKYTETARAAFLEAKQDAHFDDVHLFQDDEGTTLSYEKGSGESGNLQFVRVDLKTNKITDFRIQYKPEDVDQKVMSAAQQAFTILSNGKSASFTEARKSDDKKEDIWELTNKQERYSAQVGARSGKVYHIGYGTDYQIKSIQEVVAVANPLVQSIFGLDISGYKAYGGKDWGGYVLKQQGKPDVTVNIGSLDRGNISGISVKW